MNQPLPGIVCNQFFSKPAGALRPQQSRPLDLEVLILTLTHYQVAYPSGSLN